MSKQSRIYVVIAIVWVASLAAVGVAPQVAAQVPAFRPLPEPKILSGAEVGFRVEGMYGDVPAGVIVLWVNDKWVEAQTGAPRIRR